MPNLDPSAYPDPFFIFVSKANPATWHNLQFTGGLFSIPVADSLDECFPLMPNPKFSGAVSPFALNLMTGFRVEWDAECARRQHAPEAPSRVGAIYAFGTYADCERAAQEHGWDIAQVERFRPAPGVPITVRKVNMEIVSLMRGVYASAAWDEQSIRDVWSRYWNGESSLTVQIPGQQGPQSVTSGCIWEYLIDGRVVKV